MRKIISNFYYLFNNKNSTIDTCCFEPCNIYFLAFAKVFTFLAGSCILKKSEVTLNSKDLASGPDFGLAHLPGYKEWFRDGHVT